MSETKTEWKEYHLIRSGARAPFLQTVNGKKVALDIYNDFKPPLRYRFTDAEGKSRVYRFLRDSNIIDQAEQIKLGFLANLKFTAADRIELKFVNGKLRTNKDNVKLYLDSIPGNEAFTGDRGSYPILFKEYKPEIARKVSLDYGLKQAQAAIAMHKMEVDELSVKLLKIMGSAYGLPRDNAGELDKQAMMEAMQDQINENENALDIILEESALDTVETIIGKAVNAKVLSFIQKPDAIQIKRDNKWHDLLKISTEHTEVQKQQLFRDRLESEDGKPMLDAIKEVLSKADVQVNTENKVVSVIGIDPYHKGVKKEKEDFVEKEKESDFVEKTELEILQKELAVAIENKAHHLTIKSLERKVAAEKETDVLVT